MKNTIYSYIVNNTSVTKEQVVEAKTWADKNQCSIGHALEKLKLISSKKLLKVLSSFYKVKIVVIENIKIQPHVIALVPSSIAKKHMMVPIDQSSNVLTVAMVDPSNMNALDIVRFHSGLKCTAILATESDITLAHTRYYSMGKVEVSNQNIDLGKKKKNADEQARIFVSEDSKEGPIIKLVNDIILSCISYGASDIHVEAYEKFLRVRLRTDGILHEIASPPLHFKDALISRIKIMSQLDIAEKRLPQDGSLQIKTANREIAFRVSSIPCIAGEKIVLRILDNSALATEIEDLGFETNQFQKFSEVLKLTNGVILVTGPTGSGKTTTLYSTLDKLSHEGVNVVTAEDPVEYVLPNINQVAMKPGIGFNFATALRAFLRQDPDIIMVGEIRDLETADIAIKASLTGHIVLSTLHTNSAPDTITRLLNMGVAPFNLTASLRCVMAQRLLRRICTHCKTKDTSVSEKHFIDIGIPPQFASKTTAYKGKGCVRCNDTGYAGRIAIYEIVIVNDEIKAAIIEQKSTVDLKIIARRNGMKTLRQSAITKMAQGVTTISEVIRVTDPDTAPQRRSVARQSQRKPLPKTG